MTENLPEKIDVPVGGELQTVSASASAVAEIQSSIIVAKKFPRDEKAAWLKVMEAMRRKSLALKSTYSFPRGGKQITGPSVHVARVIAQQWGNVRWGADIIFEDDDSILLRGWAWDVEHNSKAYADHKFKKLIQRRSGWEVPNERDLRELINKNAAILKRNALLELLPPDLVEDALGIAKQTMAQDIKDPKSESKKLILAFADFGVTPDMMTSYVGTDKWGAHDCVTLQGVLTALIDNVTNREVYFKAAADKATEKSNEPLKGEMSAADMSAGDAGTHQGYENDAKPKDDKGELKL